MAKNLIDSRINTDAKDFEGLRQAFFEFAQSNYRDIWTDFNTDQFMTMIAELIAYEGDLLTYYADKQTSENFLTTAQLRQSVIDIGQMLDYRLRGPEAASGSVTFTIDPGTFNYANPIPAGFLVSNGVLFYETVSETFVTPGATSVTIPVIEGETIRQTLIGLGALAQSNGLPNQAYTLVRRNVILSNSSAVIGDDIQVTVANVSYSPVFNLVTAQSSDKVYRLNTDENNETTLTFGNGVFGLIPPSGADIEATYRVLRTERETNSFGNVNANTVTTLEDTLLGITAVTNPARFSGGRDRESIEEARINIPRSLKAGDRAVSIEDFVSIAEAFPGVAKAAALQGEGDFDIDLYLAPEGGGNPSQTLKNDVVVYFSTRKMLKTKVFPRDPVYQPVFVNLRIQSEPNNRNIDIENAVSSALADLFDFDNMAFGRGVFFKTTGGSDIYDLNETLETVNGIAKIKYNKVTLKPKAYGKKFTNLGTPEMLDDATSIRANARRREYELLMKNTDEFLMKSKDFGNSTSLNDTRLEDNLKSFLLDSGNSTDTDIGTLTDSGQFWIDNQYQFQTLIDSAGFHFKILSNTSDTLTVAAGNPADGAYQIVERLEGYVLNPNTTQSLIFRILDNDANSVTTGVGLSTVAVIGDPYEIYRYETNKYDPDAHAGTATGVSSSTSFNDNTTIGDGDDFYNDMYVIFQEGPAANIPVKVLDFVSATGTFTHETLGLGTQPDVNDRYVVSPAYLIGLRTTVKTPPTPTNSVFSANGLGGEGNDFYNGWLVHFLSGDNEDLTRRVLDYDDSGQDTLTTHDFPNAPVAGDEFQLAKDYQTDDKSISFAVCAVNPSSADIYLFQVSDLVGDLTSRANQILTLDPADLVLTVVGGS